MATPARVNGYKLLPGSKRQYQAPNGEVISRYRYDSLRLQQAGWKNRGEFERARQSQAWEGVKKWEDRLSGGKEIPQTAFALAVQPQARNAFEVETRRRALLPDVLGNRRDQDDPHLVRPGGELEQLLIAMGVRDPSWKWAVGDTPTGVSTR